MAALFEMRSMEAKGNLLLASETNTEATYETRSKWLDSL